MIVDIFIKGELKASVMVEETVPLKDISFAVRIRSKMDPNRTYDDVPYRPLLYRRARRVTTDDDTLPPPPDEKWEKVIYAADCIYEDWDEERECPTCPQCGEPYADCPCPGPTMPDEYNYKEIDGILFAKRKE